MPRSRVTSLKTRTRAGDPPLAVADRRHRVADGGLAAVAADEQRVAGELHDLPFPQAALDQVGQRPAGGLVDHVEDGEDRLAAGLGGAPAGQPLGDRVQVVDDPGGVGADDAVADRGEGHLGALLLLGEGLLGELALDLGAGAGGEDLEDRHGRQVLGERLGVHDRHVPERPVVGVEERDREVALDPLLAQPGILGEQAPGVARVVAELAAGHVLARGAAQVVLERLAVVLAGPEGEDAGAVALRAGDLGDEGEPGPQRAGQMADEGAEEVGAGGRGGAFDDGAQPLLALPAGADVPDHADHAHRGAGLVDDGPAAVVEPAVGAVGSPEADLDGEVPPGLQAEAQGLGERLLVLRVDGAQDLAAGRPELGRAAPEDLGGVRRDDQLVGHQVPFPGDDPGGALGELQAGAALAQGDLGELALGDVHGGGHAGGRPGRSPAR